MFGLGGELREVRAPAGTFVLVPPEVIHTFGNESGATARWLNFHAPSTGFIANLRSGTGFDSYDAPADGGRSSADAMAVAAGAGEPIPRPTRELAIIAETPQLSALELLVDPGFIVDPHTHADEVDSFYLVEGEIEFTVGDACRHGRRRHLGVGAAGRSARLPQRQRRPCAAAERARAGDRLRRSRPRAALTSCVVDST